MAFKGIRQLMKKENKKTVGYVIDGEIGMSDEETDEETVRGNGGDGGDETDDAPPAPREFTTRMAGSFVGGGFAVVAGFICSLMQNHVLAIALLLTSFVMFVMGGFYWYTIRFDKWQRIEGICDGQIKRNFVSKMMDNGTNIIIKEKDTGSLYMIRGRQNKAVYKDGTNVVAYISKDGTDSGGIFIPSSVYIFKAISR